MAAVRKTPDSFPLLQPARGDVPAPKIGVTPKPPRVRPDPDRANVDVDSVGRTLDELREMGALLYRGCSRLDDICRETEQRSSKVFETLDAIERRIGPLDEIRDLTRDVDTRLASARQIVEEVARRISEFQAASVDITARMSELDVRRESIDLALSAATHAAVTLDERVATFTGPEHVLRQAETAFEELEQRSTQALADLSDRVTGLGTQREAIESALTQAAQQAQALGERISLLMAPEQALSKAEGRIEEIEQRAGHALTDLGARVAELEARRETVDAALTAAVRGTDALDQRVAALMAPNHALRQTQSQVEDLEWHAAAALGDLGRRATELTDQSQTIEAFIAEAERAQRMLSDVEMRLAALTNEGERRRVETTVADLEGRASAAAAQLQRVVTKADALERVLVSAQRQLEALDKAAQRDLEKLAAASKRAGRAAKGSVPFWRIVAVSAVAALVALGIITMGALTKSTSFLETTQPILTDIPRSSPAIAATPEPLGRTAQSVPSSLLTVASAPGASSTQPAKAVEEVAQPSQATRVVARPVTREPVANSSRPAGSTRAAATTTKDATAAEAQFVGDLEVSSEPPGAAVYLDTKPVGQTPLSLRKIRAGSHVLWVVRDGFARWTRGVQVSANNRTRVSAALEPIP